MPRSPTDAGTDRRYRARRVLTGVFTVVFVLSLVGAAYVAVTPQETGNPFTELYVLNESGVAADYDTNLTVGEEGSVTVGVANREHQRMEYTLFVRARDATLARHAFTLADEESWRRNVTYSFEDPGTVDLRFTLYRGSVAEPTGDPLIPPARLIVNVSSAGGADAG